MSTLKYNTLVQGLNDLADELHSEFWRNPMFQLQRNWRPYEVAESADGYTIEVELPRVKRDQIKVEASKVALQLSVQTDKLSYSHEFKLPFAKFAETKVALADGVLTIKIPKDKGATDSTAIKVE